MEEEFSILKNLILSGKIEEAEKKTRELTNKSVSTGSFEEKVQEVKSKCVEIVENLNDVNLPGLRGVLYGNNNQQLQTGILQVEAQTKLLRRKENSLDQMIGNLDKLNGLSEDEKSRRRRIIRELQGLQQQIDKLLNKVDSFQELLSVLETRFEPPKFI
jgi:hypothetical protein